ncbi:hypothetical protein [Microvirga roseola]|uniref:hypothetical protein n=1 Tax=Microvirga roseola TaxID=2883126 RepID=UPI001E402A46|nr:hypothetical protein [Microvirga roseola]
MEHKPVEKLRSVAEVHEFKQGFLSRRERLERWAELLERQPKRRLRSLGEIEFVPEDKQPELRSDDSPLTVAFEDPVLRAAGLKSDKLGDAMEFFDLSDRAVHRLLCSCMNGWSMEAGSTARKVRRLANPDHTRLLLLTSAGLLTAAPAALYLLG